MHRIPSASALRLTSFLCLGLVALPVTGQIALELDALESTPTRASAHQPVELCFQSVYLEGEPVLNWTFSRNGRELAAKSGFAAGKLDGSGATCFTAPPVEDAGRWQNCQEPPKEFTEVYDVMAKIDTAGATTDDPAHQYAGMEGQTRFTLVREAEIEERPAACEDGEWNWAFKAGELTCKKLPFPVTLPGFTEKVEIYNDGIQMKVSGSKSGDTLVVVRQGKDVRVSGKTVPNFQGSKTTSDLFEGAADLRARYSINVLSDDRMSGTLTVKDAAYQGDVCSIQWPFEVRRAD
ncbi:MAG: hypothetical protein AAF481_05870 [Acidobacteriota bacterium]